MKKLALLLMILSSVTFAQFSNPKIVPVEADYDFGNINEGETVTHSFVVYNRGGDTLKISRVKASCGCTAAKPSKTELLPSDSTSITVSFNSTRRVGKQKKYVYVFCNDPDAPQLRLSFTANVIGNKIQTAGESPSIKLSKYNHNFGNLKEGSVVDVKISVFNRGNSDLKINKIKSSCGCTAALMSDKLLKPNESSELKIEFDTKNLSGQIARTVTLFTNDPKHPTRVLTLIANIEEG